MYDQILAALLQAEGIQGAKAKAEYLESLKPAMVQLWDAYRSPSVSVSYADRATQAAYMLRYFPPYTKILPVVLRRAGITFDAETVRAMFFGAGPGSEVYGLLDYLRRTSPNVTRVNAHLIDIASDEWQFARDICLGDLVAPMWRPRKFGLATNERDIGEPFNEADELLQRVARSDLVVFQNCMNEVHVTRHPALRRNLRKIVEALSSGSFLVAIERYGYPPALEVLTTTSGLNNAHVLHDAAKEWEYDCNTLLDLLPEAVTANKLLVRRRVYVNPPPADETGRVVSRTIKYHALVLLRL